MNQYIFIILIILIVGTRAFGIDLDSNVWFEI
jgi:hypothetical protein